MTDFVSCEYWGNKGADIVYITDNSAGTGYDIYLPNPNDSANRVIDIYYGGSKNVYFYTQVEHLEQNGNPFFRNDLWHFPLYQPYSGDYITGPFHVKLWCDPEYIESAGTAPHPIWTVLDIQSVERSLFTRQ